MSLALAHPSQSYFFPLSTSRSTLKHSCLGPKTLRDSLDTASLLLASPSWALLSDLATPAHHRQTLQSLSPPAKPAHIAWTSEDARDGEHLFSLGARATVVGVRNFPEDCPACSLQQSETNQASRENLVHEKGPISPGLWPPHTNPVQRGVHVPAPTTFPNRGARLEPRSPALPALRRGAPEPGRRVLTLAGGAGRGEVDPRAAPIR